MDAGAARLVLLAADPPLAARVAEIDEQYSLRVAAANVRSGAAKVRAKVGPRRNCSSRHRMPFNSRNEGSTCVSMTRRAVSARPYTKAGWGAAKTGLGDKLGIDVAGAIKGIVLRETLLETIALSNVERTRRDEAEFQWMHDVDVFRIIPFEVRCQLARNCRRRQCQRNEVVFEQGDDGDCAILVVEGRVQLTVTTSVGPSTHCYCLPRHMIPFDRCDEGSQCIG